jgi:hypothetical protein
MAEYFFFLSACISLTLSLIGVWLLLHHQTPAFVKHVCVPLRGRHGRPVRRPAKWQVIGGAALGNRRVATSALVRNL